jgi:tetratricopeptide (TPR) repeat protein
MLDAVLKQQPDNYRALIGICGLKINRSNAVSKTNAKQALALLDNNVRDLKAILQREPQFISAKRRLYETQGTRGNLLAGLGNYPEAATAYQDVVELSTPEEKKFHRVVLAYQWARAGNYRNSIATAQQSIEDPPSSLIQKVHLACSFCINSKAISLDRSLTPQAQFELTNTCQASALHWLQQARQQATADEWTQLVKALETEPPWLPLRENSSAWMFVTNPHTK